MELVISMVMLNSPNLKNVEDSITSIKKDLKDFKVNDLQMTDSQISLRIDAVSIAAMVIGKPIPWTDLEGPCETALFWKSATNEVKSHNCHMIISAHGDIEPKRIAFYLTKVTAAILKMTDSIGVYWGSGTVVNSKAAFIEMAEESSAEFLPLYLWIDFRIIQGRKHTFSIFTTGMKLFNLMEVEVKDTSMPPSDLLEKIFNFSHYLIDNGAIIKNNETFGLSAEERIKVLHANSFVQKNQQVYLLKM